MGLLLFILEGGGWAYSYSFILQLLFFFCSFFSFPFQTQSSLLLFDAFSFLVLNFLSFFINSIKSCFRNF